MNNFSSDYEPCIMDQQKETVIPSTEKTIINEQKSNYGGKVGADNDVGRNMTGDTSNLGGGLSQRLDEVDDSKKKTFGQEKAEDFAPKIGSENELDPHNAAASKQP